MLAKKMSFVFLFHLLFFKKTASKLTEISFFFLAILSLNLYIALSQNKIEYISLWDEVSLMSGTELNNSNLTPVYDLQIDNYLKINVGSNTDLIIKLMKKGIDSTADTCIRIVYIKAGSSYSIKNIPSGIYYLKIAFGLDLRKKTNVNGTVNYKFFKNQIFKKGEQEILFYKRFLGIVKEGDSYYENYDIPSYELFLDVVPDSSGKDFNTDLINEDTFNK